jgi:hypothetical protein
MDMLARADELPLQHEQVGELLVPRPGEDRLLQLVDAVVDRGQVREHGVHQHVQQPVERDQAPGGRQCTSTSGWPSSRAP